ncbi:hypothetical protein CEXT_747471 [Caerostris extrusa]|uniref:Uncharacterized protein n=1 Tax=Caerostris extrusa TaxID=172846 RepID=A0AAV4T8W2_CAEEX|nr:hypothetical protein CEXT_747471 [Caerostris extrusa]
MLSLELVLCDEDEDLGHRRACEQSVLVDLHDEVQFDLLGALDGPGQRDHRLVVVGPAQAEVVLGGGARARGSPGLAQLEGEVDRGGVESGPAHREQVQLPGQGKADVGHEGDVVVGVGEGLLEALRAPLRAVPLRALAAAATERVAVSSRNA